jgi:hypothetical protein
MKSCVQALSTSRDMSVTHLIAAGRECVLCDDKSARLVI